MSLIRFNPFFGEFPFRAFEEAVSRLQNEPGAGLKPEGAKPWNPAVDILETETALVVKADLPDVEQKDIDIQVENGTLSLKGERKFEKTEEKGGYHRLERSYGSFARYFSLPDTVDVENVKAEYKNGTLTLTLPKKEAAKPRQIKVAIQ